MVWDAKRIELSIFTRMRHLLFITSLLLLVNCSGQQEQSKPPTSIDWEEEFFGVGLYGNNPDSLNYVWSYHKINPNSFTQLKQKRKFRAQKSFYFDGDSISINNRFYLQYLGDLKKIPNYPDYLEDSTLCLIEKYSNGLFLFRKLEEDSLIPDSIFLKMSSKEPHENFQNLEIHTGFAKSILDFDIALFKDTALIVADCYRCDSLDQSVVIPNQKDMEFLYMFANTLIQKRKAAKRTGIICTLGYMYDMVLRFDSLEYNYDNLCINRVPPDYVHSYFSNTLDSTRMITPSNEFDDFHYIYDAINKRGFLGFEKGNDIGDYLTPPPEEPIIIEEE